MVRSIVSRRVLDLLNHLSAPCTSYSSGSYHNCIVAMVLVGRYCDYSNLCYSNEFIVLLIIKCGILLKLFCAYFVTLCVLRVVLLYPNLNKSTLYTALVYYICSYVLLSSCTIYCMEPMEVPRTLQLLCIPQYHDCTYYTPRHHSYYSKLVIRHNCTSSTANRFILCYSLPSEV